MDMSVGATASHSGNSKDATSGSVLPVARQSGGKYAGGGSYSNSDENDGARRSSAPQKRRAESPALRRTASGSSDSKRRKFDAADDVGDEAPAVAPPPSNSTYLPKAAPWTFYGDYESMRTVVSISPNATLRQLKDKLDYAFKKDFQRNIVDMKMTADGRTIPIAGIVGKVLRDRTIISLIPANLDLFVISMENGEDIQFAVSDEQRRHLASLSIEQRRRFAAIRRKMELEREAAEAANAGNGQQQPDPRQDPGS